jgi:O-6-methylguanine DNA methyltransferase
MVGSTDLALTRQLHLLAVEPPGSLVDRIYTQWARVPSAVDDVYVAFGEAGIQYLRTAESVSGSDTAFAHTYRRRFQRPLRPADGLPAGLLAELSGRPAGLVLDLAGLSGFERAVLAAAQLIPAGQTRPYSWVARQVGSPRAVRAVGTALGKNPVPLLIPCHRVTRSSGEPGDYIFGAVIKERLLRSEKVNLDEVRELADRGVHYLGNEATGIFCYPTCAQIRRVPAGQRRGFRTVAEATAAGYRTCRHCGPAA